MDVTIDTVTAEVEQRQPPQPEPPREPQRGPSGNDRPELTFMTRCERIRARLVTY